MPTLISRPWFADRPVMDRTRQIARVLAGHGLGALLHQTGFERFAPRGWRGRGGSSHSQPERLRVALGELGATFTKLGQMLSTRGDMLPAEYLAELSRLQDRAPKVPFEQIQATVERELGASIHRVYGSFDPQPLASASIGQVHAATLPDGTRVVVKVQRPGVADQIERDLQILARLVDWIERGTEYGADYDVWSLHSEFAHTIHGELDYVREGRNVDRMRRAFAGDPGIRIPIVYWPHTRPRVLTMERMEGIKITDLAALDAAGISRREIAETAVRTFLRQILDFGFFHADPHPGNFFVEPDGTIALVDFGMVGRVSESTRDHLLRCGLAAMELDAEEVAEQLYALGVAGRRADRRSFEKDVDHLISHYGGFSVAELNASAIVSELSGIAFRHRLQLPSELALLLRVISMSEGMGLMLDPGFHYLEYASPILRRSWQEQTSLRSRLGQVGRSAAEAAELSLGFPRRMQRMLSRLERGEFELNVRHERLEDVTREFQRMTNRLSMSFVLAASVVAMSVAMGAQSGSGTRDFLRWLFLLGFVFTLGFGLWLLLSMWRAGRK
jgi:ubiquinone biosynthesis protein